MARKKKYNWCLRISFGAALLAWGLIMPVANAAAQERPIRFENISVNEGLSQGSVNAILQDRRGFMWFGTQDGLNKYDGYHFTVYRHRPFDTTSLPYNFINAIVEDTAGACLWIATFGGGLARMDFVTEKFTAYKHDSLQTPSLNDNYLLSLCLDHERNLWIGSRGGGLCRMSPESGKITVFTHDPKNPNSLPHNRVQYVYEDSRKRLWVGTQYGLCELDRSTGRFRPVRLDKSTGDIPVLCIYEDHHGQLWIGTDEKGLYCMQPGSESVAHYISRPKNSASVSSNHISSIYEDPSYQLWIGTLNGLNGIHNRFTTVSQTPVFKSFRHDAADRHSIAANIIRSLFKDRSGNIWIGTNGGGLSKFHYNPKPFIRYSSETDNRNGLTNDVMLAFCEDYRGTLWIGTWGGGLFEFDRNTGRFKNHRAAGKKSDISNNNVFALVTDEQNILWIGTYDGLNRLDLSRYYKAGEAAFERYPLAPDNDETSGIIRIRSLEASHDSVLWIGTYGSGLIRLDTRRRISRFYINREDTNSLSGNDIWKVYRDWEGYLWIGTYGRGLNRLDPASGKITRYRSSENDPAGLRNDAILSIYRPNNKHYIWIGTRAGLHRLDLNTQKFTCYDEQNGFANEIIYGILEDSGGRLWVSTNAGISKIVWNGDSTVSIRNYGVQDGLQGKEFNIGAYLKTRDGQMIFGGTDGFNAFYPGKILDNTMPPQVQITSFKKFDRAVNLGKKIYFLNELELNYKDVFISFEFAALDFVNPGYNQYAYRLEGFDPDWILCGSRRYASYTNLDGGQYVFRVKGSNSDGVWNEEGASIIIIINPPFWKTWWFRGLMIVLAAGAGVAWVRIRTRAIEKQKQRLETVVQERTQEITEKNQNLQAAYEEIRRQKEILDSINLDLQQTVEELKETQHQLIQSEKMAALAHLVAGVAHEINNPLGFIDGNLTYMQDYIASMIRIIECMEEALSNDPAPSVPELSARFERLKEEHDFSYIARDLPGLIEACRTGSSRIKKIVTELKNLASVDEALQEEIDINEMILSTLEILLPGHEDRVNIITDLNELPRLRGYPGLLHQVFMNIVTNALEAIPEKGTITIRTALFSNETALHPDMINRKYKVVVTIRDTGRGISAAIRDQVFDPFFTTKEVGRGTGLGLTISYNVIQRHGGEITFTSEMGKGTEFRIYLP